LLAVNYLGKKIHIFEENDRKTTTQHLATRREQPDVSRGKRLQKYWICIILGSALIPRG